MPVDIGHVPWATLAVVGIALAVGWTILRIVLRLTLRVFAFGCIGLVILVAIVAALAFFNH
jgi:hypothetical protein